MKTYVNENSVVLSGVITKAGVVDRQNGNIKAFVLAQGRGKERDTLFTNMVAFVKGYKKRGTTDQLALLTPGSRITVKGYIEPNNWTDQNGKKHYGYVVVAMEVKDNTFTKDEQVPTGGIVPVNIDREHDLEDLEM